MQNLVIAETEYEQQGNLSRIETQKEDSEFEG
jgi:hypothetical protein